VLHCVGWDSSSSSALPTNPTRATNPTHPHHPSATVYLARCQPRGDAVVAIKVIQLDAVWTPLEDIEREVALLKSYRCPSILPLLTSFVTRDNELWVVTPFMQGGSVAHVMKYSQGMQEGLEEGVIAAVAKQVLQALEYVHAHSGIHRDVKVRRAAVVVVACCLLRLVRGV